MITGTAPRANIEAMAIVRACLLIELTNTTPITNDHHKGERKRTARVNRAAPSQGSVLEKSKL
jgi:hypothetical protein